MKKKYHIINSSNFRLDGGAMFGIIPRPLWSKKMEPDDSNRIDLALRLLLIRTEDKNILIDTGIGDYHGEKFDSRFDIRGEKNPIEKALEGLNLHESDITDLVLSHLHFDHIGGLAKSNDNNELECIFSKARFHIHKKHYQYAQAPTPRDSGSFMINDFNPILKKLISQERVNWLEEEEGIIIPSANLSYKCSHGHTPFMIHPFDDEFIYMADLIPTSHHINSAWVMGYDISPGITSQEKIKFLEFIVKNNLRMVFEHDPKYSYGKVIWEEQKGYILTELETRSEF